MIEIISGSIRNMKVPYAPLRMEKDDYGLHSRLEWLIDQRLYWTLDDEIMRMVDMTDLKPNQVYRDTSDQVMDDVGF